MGSTQRMASASCRAKCELVSRDCPNARLSFSVKPNEKPKADIELTGQQKDMNYNWIGILVIAGLCTYMASCKSKSVPEPDGINTEARKEKGKLEKADPNNNPYADLRNLALDLKMEDLGIDFPNNQTRVYGVVMDWEQGGEGTVTLVALSTGDASLYFSFGGGSIGGGSHENIKHAALDFIAKSEQYLARAIRSDSKALPGKDAVKFYFLTNKGRYAAGEEVINFENNRSQWLDLFEEGNKVITEITILQDSN